MRLVATKLPRPGPHVDPTGQIVCLHNALTRLLSAGNWLGCWAGLPGKVRLQFRAPTCLGELVYEKLVSLTSATCRASRNRFIDSRTS